MLRLSAAFGVLSLLAFNAASLDSPCGCEDGTNFCNYEDGTVGVCEMCSQIADLTSCYRDGLPDAGAEDCANRCFNVHEYQVTWNKSARSRFEEASALAHQAAIRRELADAEDASTAPTSAPSADVALVGDDLTPEDHDTSAFQVLLMVAGGVMVMAIICVVVIKRRLRGPKFDENGNLKKRVPRGLQDKQSMFTKPGVIAQKLVKMQAKAGQVMPMMMMPPPPLMVPMPAQKNVSIDVNQPFGWKRRPGDSLLITAVTSGKQAEKAGVKVGWQVLAVDGVGVSSAADFDAEIAEAKTQGKLAGEVQITFAVHTMKDGKLVITAPLTKPSGGKGVEDSGRLRMFDDKKDKEKEVGKEETVPEESGSTAKESGQGEVPKKEVSPDDGNTKKSNTAPPEDKGETESMENERLVKEEMTKKEPEKAKVGSEKKNEGGGKGGDKKAKSTKKK